MDGNKALDEAREMDQNDAADENVSDVLISGFQDLASHAPSLFD